MNINYTKGKWEVGESFDGGQEYPIYSEDGYELIRVFIHNGEQKANAHLIANSPRMIEFIQRLSDKGNQEARDFIQTLDLS